jgi:hypothetical protein
MKKIKSKYAKKYEFTYTQLINNAFKAIESMQIK